MSRKILSTLLATTMIMASVVGVSAAEEPTTSTTATKAEDAVGITLPEKVEGTYTIGYAPVTLNNAFFIAIKDGMQKAIDESGADIEIVEVDAGGDQAVMNDGIANLISSQIDALICAPADSAAVVSAEASCFVVSSAFAVVCSAAP